MGALLPHSAREGQQAREEESERLFSKLNTNEFVVLLDERGELMDSPTFSQLLVKGVERYSQVTIIIGGAYGVTEELRAKAHTVLSLSPLVFPHQLVRLILTEQLYRSQEIAAGAPYHHS